MEEIFVSPVNYLVTLVLVLPQIAVAVSRILEVMNNFYLITAVLITVEMGISKIKLIFHFGNALHALDLALLV